MADGRRFANTQQPTKRITFKSEIGDSTEAIQRQRKQTIHSTAARFMTSNRLVAGHLPGKALGQARQILMKKRIIVNEE